MADQVEWFAKSVEERSGGRMKIEIYYVGALGYKSFEALSVLKEGLLELNEMVGASSQGEIALASVPNMPFLFSSGAAEDYWEYETFMPVFNEVLERDWNAKVIFSTPDWVPIMFFSKYPLMEPEDFAGKQIRTWGGINDAAVAAIGMTPFVISTADIYTSLQRGMIDTAITSYVSATETKFWEVLDYVIQLPMYPHRQWEVMNLDAFNALPADLQEVVLTAGIDATGYWSYYVKFWPPRLLKMLTDGGMEVIVPPASTVDAFKELVKPVYQNFVDDMDTPEVTKLMKDLGAID